jgi:hypothetical protein
MGERNLEVNWVETVGIWFVAGTFVVAGIFLLRKKAPSQIYLVWFGFSFSFVCYLGIRGLFALGFFHTLFGEKAALVLDTAIGHITNVQEESLMLLSVVTVVVFPQILAYLLSGLSGSASPPRLVRQFTDVGMWALIKFFSVLAGINAARLALWLTVDKGPIVGAISASIVCLSHAFGLLVLWYFMRSWHTPPGSLTSRVHEFFTRYSDPTKPQP